MSMKSTVGFAVATGVAFGLGMHAARAATVVVSDDRPSSPKRQRARRFAGHDLDEEELNDKIADAMERIELAKKEHKDNSAIARKVEIRKGVLKAKKRELVSLRMKLVQQAEQVKMNAALAEIGNLKDVLGTIKDMMVDIDEDPTKLSVDDLTAEDPNAQRNKKVRSFLND